MSFYKVHAYKEGQRRKEGKDSFYIRDTEQHETPIGHYLGHYVRTVRSCATDNAGTGASRPPTRSQRWVYKFIAVSIASSLSG